MPNFVLQGLCWFICAHRTPFYLTLACKWLKLNYQLNGKSPTLSGHRRGKPVWVKLSGTKTLRASEISSDDRSTACALVLICQHSNNEYKH